MIIPFSILSAYYINASVSAAPVTFNLTVRGETTEPYMNRRLFGIIWGCFTTTIFCAWSAVHPNVPAPSKWQAIWSRLTLMFWMVTAPELVIAWAVRQFYAAREIRDAYNERYPELPEWKKWTLKHGYFLQMGGFTVIDQSCKDAKPEEQNGTVLTFDYFERNVDLLIPHITTQDIEDRSKGDVLFKLIVIFQTSWFILGCAARLQQQLALTQLELVTLALASLNAATFVIWWQKPLCVEEPVRIYRAFGAGEDIITTRRIIRREKFDLSEVRKIFSASWRFVGILSYFICESLRNPCQFGPNFALLRLFIFIPIWIFYIISFPIFVLFPLGILILLKIIDTERLDHKQRPHTRGLLALRFLDYLQSIRHSLMPVVGKFVATWFRNVFVSPDEISFTFGWFILLPLLFSFFFLFTISLAPFLGSLFLISFVFTAVFNIVTTTTVPLGASHVPPFYAPTTPSDRWSRMVVFAVFGVFFGAIHSAGWNFQYPTELEQTLWRATSLAITGIPLIVAPIDFILNMRLHNSRINCFEKTILLILDLIMTIVLFIYVPARLSLIIQALVLLWNQPQSAFYDINWTRYIPHI